MLKLNALLRCLLILVSFPLMAQLNPKWQASGAPDFLDLYQQSNSASIKPEIVAVFDFSTSMDCIVYHKDYPAPSSDGGTDNTIRFRLTSRSVSGTTYYYPYATLTIPDSSGTSSSRTSYTFVRPDGTVLIGMFGTSPSPDTAPANSTGDGAILLAARTNIRTTNNTVTTPWGSVNLPCNASYTTGTNKQEQDIRNWVRAASHVRFRVNNRNIDVPINWTILDTTSTGYPLSPAYGEDTSVSPAVRYPLDTGYLINYGSFSANSSTDVSIPGSTSTNCRQCLDYRADYMQWVFTGTNIAAAETAAAFANGLPAVNRTQSVKAAAIRAWLANQGKIIFAYRFLSYDSDSSPNRGESNRTVINSNSRYNPWNSSNDYFCDAPWDGTDSNWAKAGRERTWTVMNQNTSNGIRRLAATCSTGSTPLTLALANTYAQMNDTNNAFSDVELDYNTVAEGTPTWSAAKDFRPKECMRRFVILFTDGNPNSESSSTTNSPYDSSGVGSALVGNTYMVAHPTSADPGSTYWGLPTLAAAAAHLNDSSLAAYMNPPSSYPANTVTTKTVSDFLPFAVKSRGSVTFSGEYAAIQTMTFGVSLGGTYLSGSKGRLFKAAAMGDPQVKTWDINSLKPFALVNPSDLTSAKDPSSIYFFDATDAESMENGLSRAFAEASAMSNTNATSSPVIPTYGSGLGSTLYLGKFEPPAAGGPVWPGDLMMFPIREDSSGVTHLLDGSGNSLSGSDLSDPDNAQWAASKVLATKGWANRRIYTRLQATSGTPHPSMLKVTLTTSDTATSISDSGYNSIKSLLPGSTDSEKFDNWRFFVGADLTSTATVKPTRADIMGDVIDSTPGILDFNTLPSTVTSGTLTTAWADHSGDNRGFSVVFVGTNQGFLHAFGEVSWDVTVAGMKQRTGVADELWAFAPTDLLPYIDYYRNSGNAHRFGVDGSPTVYLLDLPASGAAVGDGRFDVGSSTERALVIFGLGKGGRSYYAIDVRDPYNPVFRETNATYGEGMGWSLCPDETNNYPTTRFVAPASSSSQAVITRMGLSTSVPAQARVVATSSKLVKDLIFLGGGFSRPEIEANLPSSPAPVTGTKLGRSVVAVETKRGDILGVWDLTADTTVGPVVAGVAPHTFFKGSGLTQRAYFADYWGGLWALGYTTRDANNLRMDSSWLDDWSTTPRKVYKQDPTNGLISTLPATFDVPAMPQRTTTPKVYPSAVGIALSTGDRNNPLDTSYNTTDWIKPTRHRINVIFDRQDSYLLSLDTAGISATQLINASGLTSSSDELNPTKTQFYLKNYYGYYINFPAPSGGFVPKGITSPLILGGRLFYSYFTPTSADPCSGGTGVTDTFRISNVMLPTPVATAAPNTYSSGWVLSWTGVASPLAVRSLATVSQSGMSGGSGTDRASGSAQNLQVQNISTGSSDIYPKPRVWRTVH
nr:hypothetical protein [uncultured Holophaga sp.]